MALPFIDAVQNQQVAADGRSALPRTRCPDESLGRWKLSNVREVILGWLQSVAPLVVIAVAASFRKDLPPFPYSPNSFSSALSLDGVRFRFPLSAFRLPMSVHHPSSSFIQIRRRSPPLSFPHSHVRPQFQPHSRLGKKNRPCSQPSIPTLGHVFSFPDVVRPTDPFELTRQ